MIEFKGTKGEWQYYPISEESNGYISIEIPMGSITVYNGYYPYIFSENKEKCVEIIEANAKLISCAPEMLEMLEIIFRLQKDNYGNGMETHIALIQKANEIEQLLIKIKK